MPALASILLSALFTIAASWGLGRAVFHRLAAPAVVTTGLGAAVLSLLVYTLMLGGVAGRLAFALLGAASIITGSLTRRGAPRTERGAGLPRAAWFLAPYALLYLIHALAPEIQVDAITYHLGLPAESLRLKHWPNRIGFYEMLPQGLEMLYAFAMAFGGASAAKLVHLSFLCATPALIVLTGRRLAIPDPASVAAAGLYFVTPVAGVSGASAYNDAAFVFYCLLTFFLLLGLAPENRASHAAAGLAAGFCYAVKITGLIVVPVALLYAAWRRRLHPALILTAAAMIAVAPWMVRNAWLTGNPFAPVLNQLFPNPHFHIASERNLAGWLENYGGVKLSQAPLDLAIGGARLQGLIGPAWLLAAPLALLAIRHAPGRLLLGAAAIAAVPWWFNIGARFLMPALPFIALALAVATPRAVAWSLLSVHMAASWPAVTELYADRGAWTLPADTPWRAALRLESEDDYLRRVSNEYSVARLIEDHTPAGERVLDLVGAASLYTTRELIGYWQSALGQRLSEALAMALVLDHGLLTETRAAWTEQPLAALRIRQTASGTDSWNVHEVELDCAGEPVAPARGWRLDAWPNPWESPLAVDRTPASRWSTREPMRPGMFLEVEFPQPVRTTSVRIIGFRTDPKSSLEIWGRDPRGRWLALASNASAVTRPALNLRRSAMAYLRRNRIRYVLSQFGDGGFARVGRSMVEQPGDWGVDIIANLGEVHLFRLR